MIHPCVASTWSIVGKKLEHNYLAGNDNYTINTLLFLPPKVIYDGGCVICLLVSKVWADSVIKVWFPSQDFLTWLHPVTYQHFFDYIQALVTKDTRRKACLFLDVDVWMARFEKVWCKMWVKQGQVANYFPESAK